MFKWQEDIDHLGVPAHRVLRLHQSQNEVQIALPGFPSQEAAAYVCAFSVKSGLRVTIALHLKSSHKIAFFFHRAADISRAAKDLLHEALDYAESMGFSLADTDYHLLTESQREKLWSGLPLSEGDHVDGADDILEELDELPEEPVEIIEEIDEEIPEEQQDIDEEIDEIEITFDEEPHDVEIVPDDEPAVAKEPLPTIENQEESVPIASQLSSDDSAVTRFGRFLASF